MIWPAASYPTNALGPAPAIVLGEKDKESLLTQNAMFESVTRKNRAYDRFRIYNEDFSQLVLRQIAHLYTDDDAKSQLAKNVSVTWNLALDVTKAVSVVYKHGARRTVEGASARQNEALHQLYQESKFDVYAPTWNQLSFLMGTLLVVPIIRRGKLQFDTLLPHIFDIIQDPEDYLGTPLAAAWSLKDPGVRQEADKVLLDGEAWYYYAAKDYSKPRLVVPHGIGTFPGVPFRTNFAVDADWYGSNENQRLVSATVDVGLIAANLNLVRKSQNCKLWTLIGDLSKMAKGQNRSPEVPIVINTGKQPATIARADAIDFDTNPDNFIKHIRFIYESVIESYGIPTSSVAFDLFGGTPGERMSLSDAGLTELRNAQIPFIREFEKEMAIKMVRMAKSFDHPLARKLPSEEKIVKGFRVDFGKLSRTFTDPNAEIAWKDWKMSRGLTSHKELLKEENTTLTDEQLDKLLEKYIDEQATIIERLAKRDQSLAPDENAPKTVAQKFGELGGRPNESSEDDED